MIIAFNFVIVDSIPLKLSTGFLGIRIGMILIVMPGFGGCGSSRRFVPFAVCDFVIVDSVGFSGPTRLLGVRVGMKLVMGAGF